MWRSTAATFSAQTANTGNVVSAGRVAFAANQPATAMFNLANVIPGDLFTACVKLTYTGTLSSVTRLYLRNADLTGTGLGDHLTFQVLEGTGDAADCSDFISSAALYNPAGMTDTSKTLSGFKDAAGSYATGLGNWGTSPLSNTRTYRFEWQLQATDAARGRTAGVTFTWEARTSP